MARGGGGTTRRRGSAFKEFELAHVVELTEVVDSVQSIVVVLDSRWQELNVADSDTPNSRNVPDRPEDDYVQTFTAVLSLLQRVDGQTRERILKSAATFFGVMLAEPMGAVPHGASSNRPEMADTYFSEDRSISAKQFMFEKQPRTDVEKVACLAFYLTHYRDTPHFKTLDVSKLNTEAAQIKFSNPAVAVENASKMNYLVPATKGNKQLSALGEQFVQALPNREKAKEIMANARPRRKSRKATGDSKNDLQ